MNRTKYIIFFVILAFSLPFSYGGCVLVFTTGDIEKKNTTDASDTATDYAGRTDQAVIDSTNAGDLSTGALSGGMTRFKTERAGISKDSSTKQRDLFLPLRLPLVLMDSLQKIEIASFEVDYLKPAVETKSGTLQGSCGGRLSYSIDFFRDTQTFSGSITFKNYCYHRMAISGEADVDGTYEKSTANIVTAHFSFANLSDGYFALEGEFSMDIDITQEPITANFSAYRKDLLSGQVYQIKDYSMNITEFIGFIEIEVFGTFYHPDHGYVKLTTIAPFTVHHEDDWPTSGLLRIKGENNTQAQLSPLNQVTISVEADTDGNGGFDWNSGLVNWSN